MSTSHTSGSASGCLLSLSAALSRTETVERAVDRTAELANAAFESPTISVYEHDAATGTFTAVRTSATPPAATDRNPEAIPKSIRTQIRTQADDPSVTVDADATIDVNPQGSLRSEAFASAGSRWVLRLGVTESEEFDETGVAVVEGIAANLGTALERIDGRQRSQNSVEPQELLNEGPLLFIQTRQVDGEAVIDSCSERFRRRLGYSRGELAGEPLASLYTAESAADLREGGYENALTGTFEMNERTLVDADGEPVHTLLRAVPRRDGTDGTNALFVDVTGERDASRKLRQQRERIELTLSGAHTGITDWDLGTDELTSDETFVDLVGRDVDTGDAYFEEVIHPDDADRVRQAIDEGLANGALATMTTEYRVRTADESTRWLQSRAVPEYDDDGNPVRVLAIVTDISEKKAEARERRRNERRFRSLFEDPGMLVGLLDTDGTLLDVNATAVEYVEQTAAELTGQPLPETPWWNHSEGLQNDVREWIRRAADGEYVEYSAIHRRSEGDQRNVKGTIRPVTDAEGTVTSLLISARDVTERERKQRELRDRQTKLDLVLSNTGTSVTEIDLAEGTVRWDEMAGDDNIGSPETLDGFLQTVHPEDRERVRAAFETLRADGESTDLDFRIVEADGSTVWVAAQAVPVTDDDGNATGSVLGIATDITGLKQREQALKDSRQRYRTLLEAAPDPVFVADAETGEVVELNAAAEEMRGQPREELVGMHQTELHPEDNHSLYADVFEQAVEDTATGDTSKVTALPDGTQPQLRGSDGETVPVEVDVASVQLPDGPALYSAFRDIADREERKRELEAFQRAVEEAADGVAVLEDGEYVYIDQTHVDMYGFESKDDLLGDTWKKLYDDDEVERLEAEAFPALEETGHWRGSVTGSRPDGSTFPAELSLTIVQDGRLVCTVRDETERRARERELELKERAMDEANVGIQITDPNREDNPLIYVNEGFVEQTGYTREEALGRNPRFLQGEAAEPEKIARLREAVEAEESVSLDIQNERNDGSLYWSRISLTPVTDGSGAVDNYIGIQQDITERKERQEQAEARNDFLRRIYEVTTDPERTFDEKITALLRAGRDHLDMPYGFLTRIERSEHGGSNTQTIVEAVGSHDRLQPGESAPLERTYCRRTIDNDGPLALTHAAEEGWADDPAHEAFELETYVGGEVVAGDDLYGTLCFAATDSRDRPFDRFERSFIQLAGRWVGYEIDRRDAQAELREQRERLELALSGTNTGLAEWDLETDVVRWNETLIEILGREVKSAEEFRAAVHPDDRDRVERELEAMLETGTPWTGEFRMIDGDGDTLWIGSRATPVYDGGEEPVRVLATGTDISGRKQAERERRRSERQYRRLAQNIPNGAVISFDGDLNYQVAAGELLSAFGLEPSDVSGVTVGSLLPDADAKADLLPRFRAALDGERTDRRVEFGDRTLRIHIVPIDDSGGQSVETRGLVLAQDVTAGARRERELYEEREQFRLLTESVDEYAFFIVDEEGVIQTWNDGTADTFGYDAEAAVGTSIAELHPAADRESGLPDRLLQQARIAGESAHEGWRVRADGSEFYADVRHAPLETDDSEFRGYAVIVRDMTERRRQRRRTERFVEESEDVITVVDPDGTVTYVSGSATRVLGYDPDDLVGQNLFDYLHPDSRERAMEAFFTGVDDRGSFQAECRVRSGDGGWLNVEGRCRNMLDDDAIDGMLWYLRDVTERTERARRFESIFNQTFQFTALLEPDGTVVEVNDAALEFGGIERDAIAGTRLGDARWWTHSEAVRDNVVDAIDRAADGEFVRYETEVRGADGLATIDFSLKPVTDEDDDVSLLVAEGRNITSREQHRRHLEVMQRVVRHNMRNDLTKVRGWAQLMAEEEHADERAEKLETIEGIVDKWVAMSEKMRNIGQLLEGQRTHSRTAECETIVRDAVESVRDKHDGGTIRTETTEGGSARVPTTVGNAVHELMENAVQAGDDATVAVDLARPDEDWVEVRVSDDGPGIPEMEAEVLETGEETPLTHGLGLGLWMVRMVVTQAGGTVSVESSDGGTEVRLRLPATRRGGAQAGTGAPE